MNENKKISLDTYLEKAIPHPESPHPASPEGEGQKTIYYIT